MVLKDLGLDPAGKEARKTIDRVDKRLVFAWLNNRPYLHGETEPCINGRILGIGSYFKEPNDALAHELLGEQLEDGGWNCEAHKKAGDLRSIPPSACSKDCSNPNEQGANLRPSPGPASGPKTICSSAGMFRSLRTGEVIDKRRLRFSFPTVWHYDQVESCERPRRSPRMTHFCSVRVTHTKNTIWRSCKERDQRYHPRRRRAGWVSIIHADGM